MRVRTAIAVTAVIAFALTSGASMVTTQTSAPGSPAPGVATPEPATYVGSQACRRCHAATYERWSKTRMANVVRDPREHPEAVLPDFTKPDPALTFRLSDVSLVYGSKWKQRYFKKVGNDYFPLPAQWDVTHRLWRPYQIGRAHV